jgi:hypothetical protein
VRKVQALVVIVGLMFAFAACGQDNHKVAKKIEPLPRDLEIQLALSALPAHLRDQATVVCQQKMVRIIRPLS